MYLSKRSASSEAPLYSDWASRLLRFFQLLVGDQAAAENLTIETLVEGSRLGGVRLSIGLPATLVRHAVEKARTAPEPNTAPEDSMVLAIKSLSHSQRLAVVLFRGLGLPLEEVADVAAISERQARHLCADGLLAIARFLADVQTNRDSATGTRAGEYW